MHFAFIKRKHVRNWWLVSFIIQATPKRLTSHEGSRILNQLLSKVSATLNKKKWVWSDENFWIQIQFIISLISNAIVIVRTSVFDRNFDYKMISSYWNKPTHHWINQCQPVSCVTSSVRAKWLITQTIINYILYNKEAIPHYGRR